MERVIKKIYNIARIFLFFIPIFILLILLNKYYVFDGIFEVEHDFSNKYHPFISVLRPNERLGGIEKNKKGQYYAIVNKQPVYFDIETSKDFKEADIEVEYKPIGNIDFKIGVLVDKKNWQYDLKPIANYKIEELLKSWPHIKEKDIILFDKNGKYSSIDGFLNNLPSNRAEIAAYNFNIKDDFKILGYKASQNFFEFNNVLCGYHQFYTYLKKEDLDFVFDVTRKKNDKNSGVINVYSKDKIIKEENIAGKNQVKLNISDLNEGAYKIELKFDENLCVDKIVSKQQYLTFINKINLANDNNLGEKKLYTDSPLVKMAASRGDALQNVMIGGEKIKIDDLYKQFEIKNYDCEIAGEYCLAQIKLEKDNLLIQGAGLFSFKKESFLNPKIKYLDNVVNLESINYVIAKYKMPENMGEWKKVNIKFDLSHIRRDRGKYNFIISIHGVGEEEAIYINKVKAVFK